MAKCNSCNRLKVDTAPFGGSLICSSCMNIYNPKTDNINRFTEFDINWREKRISELRKELHILEHALSQNKRLFEDQPEEVKSIAVKVGTWTY